jgi:hypothetical protein
MNRRRALACVGSAIFAGCLSESTPGGSEPVTSDTTNGTKPTTNTTTNDGNTATGTGTPASPTLEIPSENHCPSFGDGKKRVVCYQDADSGMTLLMKPSKKSVELPKAMLSFTLQNETGVTFTTNYYDWSLWKRVDGEWFHLMARAVPEPAMVLESGDSHSWTVTIDNTNLGDAVAPSGGTEDLTFTGLGGGTYAFGIDGWFEGVSYKSGVGVATRFELVGDALELTPTADLEVVERDGDEKHVRVGDKKRRTMVATRVETSTTAAKRMLPEQVVRSPLRNLLASFEPGVRRVTLDVNRTAIFVSDPQVIEYEGQTYRIERSG